MDLRSGVVLPEQRDNRPGGSWVPGTPAKTMLNKLAAAADGQGSNSMVPNWFKAAAGFSDRADGPRVFAERAVDVGGGDMAAAAPETFISSCDANVAMRAQSMGETIQGWRQTRCTDCTVRVNLVAASSNAAASLPMFIHGHPINGMGKSDGQLLLNGKVILSGELLNDVQSKSAACGTAAPPFAPVTPEKHLVGRNGGHTGSMDSIDKGKMVRGRLGEASFLPAFDSSQKGPIQLCFDKEAMEQAEFVPGGLSSQLQESKAGEEAEKQGIDLNKTPQQKPRRKKHRPKVIQEGKPSRTPKSSTSKPATTGENVSKKRKYVRRKGLNSPLETPSSVMDGKNIELNTRKGARSAKRCLDFSTEDNTAAGAFQCNTSTTSQKQLESLPGGNTNKTSGDGNNRDNSSDVIIAGQKVSVTSSSGIEALLNPSNEQILETFISSLDIPSVHLQPSRKELIRKNLKKLGSVRDSQQVQSHGGIKKFKMQTNGQLTSEDKFGPTSASNLPSADRSMRNNEWNADHDVFIDGTHLYNVNVVQADFNCEKTCSHKKIDLSSQYLTHRNNNLPHFPEVQKKRRTEKEHNELAFKEVASFTDALRTLELERMRAEGKQAFGRIEVETFKSPKTPAQACNLATDKNTRYDQFSSTLQNPNMNCGTHDNGIIQKTQHCTVSLAATAHAKVSAKRQRKKEEIKVAVTASPRINHLGLQEQDFAMCNLRQKSGRPVSSSASNSEPQELQFVQVTSLCDGIRTSHEMRGASYSILLHSNGNEILHSLDYVIQKMKYLNINEDEGNNVIQEQSALVPYGANGVIVPFEGQFYPTKKLRHRAKIALDEETKRVWNLLMGKESNGGVEGTAADKGKWWEEERRVFHGRADSFIARMHLVQGDRRFSPWKGSVLDSVIGVFLTQNVSDHLSSSAFMALAARFPFRPRERNGEALMSTDQKTSCNVDNDVTGKHSDKLACEQNSEVDHGSEQMGEKQMHPSESDTGVDMCLYSKDKDSVDAPQITTQDSNIIKTNIKKPMCCTNSSQNSVVSSQNSTGDPFLAIDQIGSSSDANSEAENLITSNQCTLESKTSFLELLEMAESSSFPDLYIFGKGVSSGIEIFKFPETENFNSPFMDDQRCRWTLGKEGLYSPSIIASRTSHINEVEISAPEVGPSENATEISHHEDSVLSLLTSLNAPSGDFQAFTGNLAAQRSSVSITKTGHGKHSCCHDGTISLTTEFLINDGLCSVPQDDISVERQLKQTRTASCSTNIGIASQPLSQIQNCKGHQFCSGSPHKQVPNVGECVTMPDKSKGASDKRVESNSADEICISFNDPMGSADGSQRRKRGKLEAEKRSFDWDSLRRQVCQNGAKKERNSDAMDSLDWEAVRDADVNEISSTIRERGMNNKLAERIKGFLDRLMREHGSIDLEWLRDVPPDKAKEFLLSIKGLGLKSVECVRLLTLHHLAFPVDTNVGRICVRLGWVPLQPLPESLQLHLLELYPMLETIQKYLWPRLCTLDQRTLYELHYQMITFGKVFCTKSKPNCNACPMRGECRHFASAFASARLALPGPEDKSMVTSSMGQNHKTFTNPKTLLQLDGISLLQVHASNNCEPIIEEPATPEPECTQIPDIEDAFYEDPEEIPSIKLNIEEFAQNLQNYMQQNDMEIHDINLSQALVAITPEAASIPVPKLKNVSRLRTEHQVYELPDSHPLLEGLDRREAHDPCPYFLAIWTPGETAQSTEPPESCCNAQGTGNLCNERTCFSCNSIREAQTQTVRGTLLIPCRTAMRGSFPLNGTYFQVNEVFADHETSLKPIDVPRGLIWNLPRRTVYFGTSVPTIFRGLAIEAIQNCFWRGFVCVRGFDRKTRGPRPLMARLHIPSSKANRNKRSAMKEDE